MYGPVISLQFRESTWFNWRLSHSTLRERLFTGVITIKVSERRMQLHAIVVFLLLFWLIIIVIPLIIIMFMFIRLFTYGWFSLTVWTHFLKDYPFISVVPRIRCRPRHWTPKRSQCHLHGCLCFTGEKGQPATNHGRSFGALTYVFAVCDKSVCPKIRHTRVPNLWIFVARLMENKSDGYAQICPQRGVLGCASHLTRDNIVIAMAVLHLKIP